MSAKSFTIRKTYALSAINKEGKRVYYGTDQHSGGWPYWSIYPSGRKEFDTLDEIPVIDPKHFLYNQVTSIEVLEISYNAKVIRTTELVSEARAKAEAEIAKIQKELEQKISLLESVK